MLCCSDLNSTSCCFLIPSKRLFARRILPATPFDATSSPYFTPSQSFKVASGRGNYCSTTIVKTSEEALSFLKKQITLLCLFFSSFLIWNRQVVFVCLCVIGSGCKLDCSSTLSFPFRLLMLHSPTIPLSSSLLSLAMQRGRRMERL